MASRIINLFSRKKSVNNPGKNMVSRPLLRLRSALMAAGRDLDGLEREVKVITKLNFGSKKEKANALADLFVKNLTQAQQGLPPELIKGCERLSAKIGEIKYLLNKLSRDNFAFIRNSVQEKIADVRREIQSVTRVLGEELAREAA